jgi:hypothetical protein
MVYKLQKKEDKRFFKMDKSFSYSLIESKVSKTLSLMNKTMDEEMITELKDLNFDDYI